MSRLLSAAGPPQGASCAPSGGSAAAKLANEWVNEAEAWGSIIDLA